MNSRPYAVLSICLLLLAISMSLYVWQLRKHVVTSENVPPSQVVPAPQNGSPKTVTLWIAHDDPGTLKSEKTSLALSADRQRRSEQILATLLAIYTAKNSPHHLAATADIRNVYFVDPGLVVIDVNSSFADGQTSGVFAEELLIASLIQTLSENIQGISRVKILVNGKEAESLAGHADLSRSYDVAQIAELGRQLASQ